MEDYGWALAGRNTIDLYMPTRSAMNSWGAREENIQILQWGDPERTACACCKGTRVIATFAAWSSSCRATTRPRRALE